jgi:ATP-dependent Lhr-like helicase
VLQVIERLAGAAIPAGAWEDEVLRRRLDGYDQTWLDQLCFAGQVAWARLDHGSPATTTTKAATRTLRTSSIALLPRDELPLFSSAPAALEHLSSGAQKMLEVLRTRGASFFVDLARASALLPEPAEQALAELVGAGVVTADGFAALRTMLMTSKDRERLRRRARGMRASPVSLDAGGRWAMVHEPRLDDKAGAAVDARAEAQATVLLRRFGVVFKKLVEREPGLLPWRDVLAALRRMEARGTVRGGRFVVGFSGEQFALPEVVSPLRAARRLSGEPAHLVISATDPMNLTGVILPGVRVPAVLGHRLLLEDGLVVAVKDASGVRLVDDTRLDPSTIHALLQRRPGTPTRASAAQKPAGVVVATQRMKDS